MALIDLQKKVEIVLAKRNALSARARVGLAVDVSGSMAGLYKAGVVQRVVERFLALAMRLDDDRRLDCWAFDQRVAALPAATEADFDGYVSRAIVAAPIPKWGGTAYGPPIAAALAHWFPDRGLLGRLFGRGAAAGAEPALLLFVTDGENSDAAEALAAMKEAAGRPLYFAFVGIGPGPFRFIEQVADAMPNVGFLSVPDIARISDDDLYDRLVTQELADWLRGAQRTAAA